MADLFPRAELRVNGLVFTAWKSVQAVKSIESVAGGFSFDFAEKLDLPINHGDECSVTVNGEYLITGYIDQLDISTGSEKSFKVSGRDKAGDLVDCSIDGSRVQYDGQTLMQIARAICEPFGIQVRAEADTGKAFPRFAVQTGETAWQALERLARQRGLLLVSDGLGAVVFIQPSTANDGPALVQGANVVTASASFDMQARFSRYVVKGQAPGDDDNYGDATNTIQSVATDPGVKRYRPLVILNEMNTDTKQTGDRALFEASNRAARAAKFTVEVAGWLRGDNGKLWRPNTLVTCDIPDLRLSGSMLISEVEYNQGDSGSLVRLTLARPDAYRVAAITKKSDVKRKGDKSTPYEDVSE